MKTKTIVALSPGCPGIVVTASSGITVSTAGKPVNFLGIHGETPGNHVIPPAVGMVGTVSGVDFLAVDRKVG